MFITEFQEGVIAARSLSDVNTQLNLLMQHFGVSMFSFTYYGSIAHSTQDVVYSFASKDYELWHQHYLTQSYQDVDNTMNELVKSMVPIHWDLQQQLRDATTERERQMRLDSIALGAEKGVIFPLHGPNSTFATFLLVQMNNQNFLDVHPGLVNTLLPAAYHYFQAIKRHLALGLLQDAPEKITLSDRELQVLLCLVQSMNVPVIARVLNITARTVNFHIQRINKKLGVKNKHQSVAKALKLGLVEMS